MIPDSKVMGSNLSGSEHKEAFSFYFPVSWKYSPVKKQGLSIVFDDAAWAAVMIFTAHGDLTPRLNCKAQDPDTLHTCRIASQPGDLLREFSVHTHVLTYTIFIFNCLSKCRKNA